LFPKTAKLYIITLRIVGGKTRAVKLMMPALADLPEKLAKKQS